ncbi:MAG TPA: hypothetical protein VMY78_16485 [Solirubrobacteraceae bacterium]|nr:hypothetical protein [Solirubrobacteraceae bacterium]
MPGLLVVAMLALLLAGCANSDDEPLPAACLDGPAALVLALQRAPAAVRLADGSTRVSTCVRRVRSDGELQELGVALTTAADTLRRQVATDPAAAVMLGYLAGAVTAGADANQSLASELRRKVERVTALAADAPQLARAAHDRGLRAGGRSG